MPPMGPPGRGKPEQKPKQAKQTFTRILKYMGKSKLLLIIVFLMLIFILTPQNQGHHLSSFQEIS